MKIPDCRIKLILFLFGVLAGTLIVFTRQATPWALLGQQNIVSHANPPLPCTNITPNGTSVKADSITMGTVIVPHHYRHDGILEVSPSASHPIYDLITDAQNRWQAKLNRASRNLREAVHEYRRRYGRPPPKGFDKWWEYVQTHNVQLPDEYDQIWMDIAPFWGFDPLELQQHQAEHASRIDSYTIGKTEGAPITVVNQSLSDPKLLRGSGGILSMLKEVEKDIPPFRAVFSPHDNPYMFLDYGIKQAALQAARSNRRLKAQDIPPVTVRGWMNACPSSSPGNNATKPGQREHKNKTFIHNHRKAMDPCLHPKLLEIHGQFLPYASSPPIPSRHMTPLFSYCSTTLHYDIRIPSFLSWVEDIHPREHDPEWDGRHDERLSWRGSNTGMWQTAENRWKEAHRPRLVNFANDNEGEVNVLVPSPRRDDPVGKGVNVQKSKINPALFDIAFAGSPLQCPPDYCKQIEGMFDWRRHQGWREAGNFKYVLDVDGNGWSSRFQRLQVSNALIFKATIYPEWFLDRIQPWVHYVPVQTDFSDLHDALLFFRGGLYGEGSHNELARKIAQDSRQWAKTFWRKADMTAYVFRLMLEYARVMSPEREKMGFTI